MFTAAGENRLPGDCRAPGAPNQETRRPLDRWTLGKYGNSRAIRLSPHPLPSRGKASAQGPMNARAARTKLPLYTKRRSRRQRGRVATSDAKKSGCRIGPPSPGRSGGPPTALPYRCPPFLSSLLLFLCLFPFLFLLASLLSPSPFLLPSFPFVSGFSLFPCFTDIFLSSLYFHPIASVPFTAMPSFLSLGPRVFSPLLLPASTPPQFNDLETSGKPFIRKTRCVFD